MVFRALPKNHPIPTPSTGLEMERELARLMAGRTWRDEQMSRAEELIYLMTDHWATPPHLRSYLQVELREEHFETTEVRHLYRLAVSGYYLRENEWLKDSCRKEILVTLK